MKQDKEKFKIPRGVQDVIPIRSMWKNGTFLVGNNKYSKTFQFTDINYGKASEEEKAQVVTQRESVSFMKDAMRRLVRNKMAMTCLVILILITLFRMRLIKCV